MIKVLPGRYFASVEENKALNQYLIEKFGYDNFPPDGPDMYLKEKYNCIYVPGEPYRLGEPYSLDLGYFLFENERDAIMFILRWS